MIIIKSVRVDLLNVCVLHIALNWASQTIYWYKPSKSGHFQVLPVDVSIFKRNLFFYINIYQSILSYDYGAKLFIIFKEPRKKML